MLIFYSFLFLFGAYEVTRADLKTCSRLVPEKGVPPVPKPDELTDICPNIIAFIKCYETEMEEHPEEFDEYNQLFHEHLGGLVIDVCNKTSRIHKAYLESIECFEVVQDKFNLCLEGAKTDYRKYKRISSAASDLDEISYFEKDCLTRGQAVGCMTKEIMRTCGTLQLSTYIELVQRSHYLAKFCDSSAVEQLRTKYLDYLNVDESLKEIYKIAFEYEN